MSTTELAKMLPSDYIGYKKCLDAVDELLSAYNKMATDPEKEITMNIIYYRIRFIARLSTDKISFEDQVKILTQLINSRRTIKTLYYGDIDPFAIDSVIKRS